MSLSATSFAASAGTEAITGVVTNKDNGSVVVGAQVVVICEGNTKTTTTSSTGIYSVQYTATQCPNKAVANATASYGGQSGSSSGEIKNENLSLTKTNKPNVTVVPVFGLVAGVVATVIGGAGYLTIRRS